MISSSYSCNYGCPCWFPLEIYQRLRLYQPRCLAFMPTKELINTLSLEHSVIVSAKYVSCTMIIGICSAIDMYIQAYVPSTKHVVCLPYAHHLATLAIMSANIYRLSLMPRQAQIMACDATG